MADFNKAMRWLIAGSLLLAAGCTNGKEYRPGPTPGYGSPHYYYGPGGNPEQDPEFWIMWQNQEGGSSP
ncbi:MAG: hypothetical protein M1438_06000 [Deltaproteobacteria bacterium]|nr:hypothetical protein [Deltaproteobacteria bacterium]